MVVYDSLLTVGDIVKRINLHYDAMLHGPRICLNKHKSIINRFNNLSLTIPGINFLNDGVTRLDTKSCQLLILTERYMNGFQIADELESNDFDSDEDVEIETAGSEDTMPMIERDVDYHQPADQISLIDVNSNNEDIVEDEDVGSINGDIHDTCSFTTDGGTRVLKIDLLFLDGIVYDLIEGKLSQFMKSMYYPSFVVDGEIQIGRGCTGIHEYNFGDKMLVKKPDTEGVVLKETNSYVFLLTGGEMMDRLNHVNCPSVQVSDLRKVHKSNIHLITGIQILNKKYIIGIN